MSATPSQSASMQMHRANGQNDSFRPSWLFRNGHVQTLAGTYVFGRWPSRTMLPKIISRWGEVPVGDGDRLVYLDECPGEWRSGDRVVLLLHGLSGSHDSPYMRRVAGMLHRRNARTIRLDWRGSGAGIELARYPYHSGRSGDLLATINEIKNRIPNSPINVVGFSMGGNILLKLLGESGDSSGITRAVSVCPPVDLAYTVQQLQFGLARYYDHYFAKACIRDVRRRQQMRPDAIVPDGWFSRPPRTMREFDESFTAPVCGFASADDYYLQSSARQFLPKIVVPTLIIAAQDDPVVPFGPLESAELSSAIQISAPRHGGHMGFVTSGGPGWLDRQIVDWASGES